MKAKESQKIAQRDEKAFQDTLDIQVEDNRIENEKNQQQSSSSSRNKSRNFEKLVLKNYLMSLIIRWAPRYLLLVRLNMKTKQLENS